MPVVIFKSPPLSIEVRQRLAELLTNVAATVADADRAKVHVFFSDEQGPPSLDVHAVGHEEGVNPWVRGFQVGLADLARSDVRVHLYPPDHTAKGGILRTLVNPASTDPEGSPV